MLLGDVLAGLEHAGVHLAEETIRISCPSFFVVDPRPCIFAFVLCVVPHDLRVYDVDLGAGTLLPCPGLGDVRKYLCKTRVGETCGRFAVSGGQIPPACYQRHDLMRLVATHFDTILIRVRIVGNIKVRSK